MQLQITTFAPVPDRTYKPHGFSLDPRVVRDFAAACAADGRTQTTVIEAMMRAYVVARAAAGEVTADA
jgi:hypothetical protein